MLQFWEVVYPKAVKHEKWYLPLVGASIGLPFLTVVWKIWYTSDTSYIMQTIIAYQHLPPTKFLLTFVGLYSPDNDQTILLNIENKIGNA